MRCRSHWNAFSRLSAVFRPGIAWIRTPRDDPAGRRMPRFARIDSPRTAPSRIARAAPLFSGNALTAWQMQENPAGPIRTSRSYPRCVDMAVDREAGAPNSPDSFSASCSPARHFSTDPPWAQTRARFRRRAVSQPIRHPEAPVAPQSDGWLARGSRRAGWAPSARRPLISTSRKPFACSPPLPFPARPVSLSSRKTRFCGARGRTAPCPRIVNVSSATGRQMGRARIRRDLRATKRERPVAAERRRSEAWRSPRHAGAEPRDGKRLASGKTPDPVSPDPAPAPRALPDGKWPETSRDPREARDARAPKPGRGERERPSTRPRSRGRRRT